jgi:O-antigen/teichoic acid export membrane protein
MSWYFARKIKIAKIKATKAIVIAEGKNMVKMGVILSISGLISLASSYIVRVYISSFGDVAQVGLYTAGFAIISTYVGLIFSAMGTDYYPRLAAVAYDNTLCKQTINQQAEIAILILAPIIMVFLVFIQWVVILLYSSKFIAINEMIHWAALGMIFKTASWAIGFILLAKGSAKLFFYNDLFSNIYLLALNLLGYKFWGLTGMGMSFLVGYFLHFIQMFLMGRILYQFSFDKSFIRVFSFQIVLAISCFLVVKFFNSPLTYILGGVLILVSTFFSYRELDKRIDIKQIISKFRKK